MVSFRGNNVVITGYHWQLAGQIHEIPITSTFHFGIDPKDDGSGGSSFVSKFSRPAGKHKLVLGVVSDNCVRFLFFLGRVFFVGLLPFYIILFFGDWILVASSRFGFDTAENGPSSV